MIVVFGTLSFLIFSDSGYKLEGKPSVEAYDLISDARIYGKPVELKGENVNSLFASMIREKIVKGDFTLYGIEARIKESKITFYSPVSYKGIRVLLSASGSIEDNGNYIIFKPSYIKAGRLKLPVGLFMSKMKNTNISVFKFNEDTISIDKILLPFTIESIKIVDDYMVLAFKKPESPEQVNPSNPTNTNNGGNSNSNLSQSQNSSLKNQLNSKPTSKSDLKANQDALKKLSSQLGSAIRITKGDREKDILCRIKASVDKRIASPNYNIYREAKDVTAKYNALSEEERVHIKSAILSTVDIQNAMELKEIFGL